jgi:hypothetical protein
METMRSSTSPAARKSRTSALPPTSQMSRPSASRSRASSAAGSSRTKVAASPAPLVRVREKTYTARPA